MRKHLRILVFFTIITVISFADFGCQKKSQEFYIGVLQWTEKIEAYNQTYKGLLDVLDYKGYKEGLNLKIDYKNVEQDKNLALKSAQRFVKNEVDLIVALGTGSSLAALKATEKKRVPIVFSIVGAPKATGIIHDYNDSRRNITGVSMKVPVKEQFQVVKEVLPDVKKLGIIYCTEMPQAVATGKEATASASEFGWQQLTVSFPEAELRHLGEKVQSLVKKVDAIYIPTDPILHSPENLRIILHLADKHKVPVFAVAKRIVEKGALAAVHCDFYEIGRQAANPIVQVFEGFDVRTIPPQKPTIKKISLNLKKAERLNIKIKRNVILKADNIFD